MSETNLINTFTNGRHKLRALARRFLSNDTDVDDVLQEAFVRLWPNSLQLKDQSHSDAAAAKTIRHVVIDRSRRNTIDTTEIPDNLPLDNLTEDNSELREIVSDVEEIINANLTEVQQSIIRMRDYEEREFDEIAQILNMQPTAVRMQLSRARKRIREIYNSRKI